MSYIVANEHFDKHHVIDWGFDVFNAMEAPKSDENEAFNKGYRTLVDFETAKCPCGASLVGNVQATLCSACGTITCSAECHDRYVQS